MSTLTRSIGIAFLTAAAAAALTPAQPKPGLPNAAAALEVDVPVARPNAVGANSHARLYAPGELPPAMDAADLRAMTHLQFDEFAPAQFDHKTTVWVQVADVDNETELRQRCGWAAKKEGDGTLAGCALRLEDGWTILLGPEADMKQHAVTRNMVLRHETAHVNGWPWNHPGATRVAAPEAAPAPTVVTQNAMPERAATAIEEEEPDAAPLTPPRPRRRPPRYAPPPPGVLIEPLTGRAVPCLPMIVGLPFCL